MPTPEKIARDAAICAAYAQDKSLAEVGAMFGLHPSTVAQVLDLNGVQRRPACLRTPRFDADKDQRMVAAYTAGASLMAVAAEFGASRRDVESALRRASVKPRHPTLGRNQRRPEVVERDQKIAAAYASGLSLSQVAEKMGISAKAADKALRRLGVPRRTAKQGRQLREEARAKRQPKAAPKPKREPKAKAAARQKPAALVVNRPPVPAAPRFADLDPIVPAGVKVTVCPSGKDHRFTVARPEPFFARGVSLPPSPWVAAVTQARQYGGQR